VPVYYVTLVAYIILVVLVERNSVEGRAFFRHLPYYLTYTSNWFVNIDGRVIFAFVWMLAAIMQFYVVWPPIEKYLTKIGAIVVAVCVLGLVIATENGLFDRWLVPGTLGRRIVISIPESICLGVLLAHVLDNRQGYRLASKVIGQRWSSVALLVTAVGFLFWLEAPRLIVSFTIVLFVCSCAIREDHFLSPVLGSRTMRSIGRVGYGMYLFHMLVFNALKGIYGLLHIEHPLWYFGSTFIGSALVAHISFRYYESYFVWLRTWFSLNSKGQRRVIS